MAQQLKPIRQGDVWIIPLTDEERKRLNSVRKFSYPPLQPKRRTSTNGDFILAAGEATGHHHRVATKGVKLYSSGHFGGALVLSSPAGGCTVTHEEHAELEIPEGLYKVVIAREYTPGSSVRVRD